MSFEGILGCCDCDDATCGLCGIAAESLVITLTDYGVVDVPMNSAPAGLTDGNGNTWSMYSDAFVVGDSYSGYNYSRFFTRCTTGVEAIVRTWASLEDAEAAVDVGAGTITTGSASDGIMAVEEGYSCDPLDYSYVRVSGGFTPNITMTEA